MKINILPLLFFIGFASAATTEVALNIQTFSDLHRPEWTAAQKLKEAHPTFTPETIARNVFIGQDYKNLISWMKDELELYLANFDVLFENKLRRIFEHQQQRRADLQNYLKPLQKQLEQEPTNEAIQIEIARVINEHKEHGFIAEYQNADDFEKQFVGPKGKVLKMRPTAIEIQKMNQPGAKKLYVDTWAVPFFNRGTQSKSEAKEGVQNALEILKTVDTSSPISMLRFTELVAIYGRPEFNDIRRYKLQPFPSKKDRKRFAAERSDALMFGDNYPAESILVSNKIVDLDPLSYTFGQREHFVGLMSHAKMDILGDGRIFTGTADFLEHDYAHIFFSLILRIPGTPEDWQLVHKEFARRLASEPNLKMRQMMSLVYFHFTHESGYKALLPKSEGSPVDPKAFENEIHIIKELIHTRYYYDFILKTHENSDSFESYLESAFMDVSHFFKTHFAKIQKQDFGKHCGIFYRK